MSAPIWDRETGKSAPDPLDLATTHMPPKVNLPIHEISGAIRTGIADDGKSFDAEKVLLGQDLRRLDPIGVREPLEMVGGSLAIESAVSP
jgi:signal transduction histidine kinase